MIGLTPDPRHGVLSPRLADGLTGDVEVLDRMRVPFEQAHTPEGFAKVSVDPETHDITCVVVVRAALRIRACELRAP
jgi:hypothetical protein